MSEVVATANQSNFMSRQDMLQWINDALKLNEKKIENLGTGAIFCQLFDMCYPGKVQMSKVNWKAKYENEYVANFKILQQAFDKMQVNKPIDVNKLIKCKYQDNLEFLQWMRKYHDQFRKNDKPYDAVSRRNGQILLDVLQDKLQQPHLIGHSSSIQTNQDTCASSVISASSSNNNNNILNIKQHQFLRNSNKKSHTTFMNSAGESSKPFPNSSQSSVSNISMDQDSAQIEDNDGKVVEQFQVSNNNHLNNHIQHQGSSNNNNNNNITDINILDEIEKSEKESCVKKLRDERDFVMEKLKQIDQLLDGVTVSSGHSGVDVKRLIKCILYATNDNLLTVLDDGNLTITDQHMQEVNANSFENFQGLQRLQQEILQTDTNLKAIKQKHKKQQQTVFDPNQENRQLLPPTYPINAGISQIVQQQQLNLGMSGNNYDNNLGKSAGGNNQLEKSNGITAISLNVPQQQTSLFNKESGFKTPQSGKYSYEQALQLDDFSSSISSNTNTNQLLQIPQSQQPVRKNSTPLYEILVNDENISSKPKILVNSQQQEITKGVSFVVPGSAEGTKSNNGGEMIKIQPVKQDISFPKQDVFEKLSDNLFDAQDEDLLGNLE